eukprot:10869947-Lingulodinium_polyedra.AAC.1
MLAALAAQLCQTGSTAAALGAVVSLGMRPCMASQDEVDAMLAAEALVDDVAPGTQSCAVDVWP